MNFTIEALQPDAVAEYAHARVVLLEVTYAHLMGPDYARDRWAELDSRVERLTSEVAEEAAARASGVEGKRTHLLARSARGTILGVACRGQGVAEWEREHLGELWTPPTTLTNLAHLYTMPSTHGTGLGQAMLDALLPGGAPAYLWVMADNTRAMAFYRRNGFRVDLGPVPAGESWGRLGMYRMTRP